MSNNSAAIAFTDIHGGYGIVCHRPSTSHTVTWYGLSGSPLPTSRTKVFAGSITEDEDHSELRIASFNAFQNGVYTCVTTDENGANQSLFLGVYDKNYSIQDVNLNVSIVGPSNESEARLLLTCSSRGLPATSVSWFYGEHPIGSEEAMTQLIPDRRRTVYHSMLTLTKQELANMPRERENDRYKCQVEAEAADVTRVNAFREFRISKT